MIDNITSRPLAAMSYPDDDLKRLTELVKRANRTAVFEAKDLECRIFDLLCAVGVTNDGSEYAIEFKKAVASELSHSELAATFRLVSRSKDPLAHKKCCGCVRAELNAHVHTRWASRLRKDPRRSISDLKSVSLLSRADVNEVRESARALALFHRSRVRQGKLKIKENTLLDGLADIYLELSGLDGHRYDLGQGERALFINFAHVALRPFFSQTEVTLKALTNRWAKLKKAHRQGAP